MRLRLLEWLDTWGHRLHFPGAKAVCDAYDRAVWAQFDAAFPEPAPSYNYGDLES